MKKITITILITGLLLSIASLGFSEKALFINEIDDEIFNEIQQTEDKILVVDKIIEDRHVKYWEHVITNVLVKNDSILLHLDPETGDILEYERSWTDVELELFGSGENILTLKDYIWKKPVVFPDEEDCNIFYSFYVPVEYPLFCWEIRYNDGTTILYDSDGNQIGHAVSAPRVESVVIKGYDPENDWSSWFGNAQGWFKKWCDEVQSKWAPDLSWISDRVSDPELEFFYVIAHSVGQSDRFLAKSGVYYNATRLQNDMSGRSPMKLAVLCCCSAMEDTGPGTLSYEFRKGQMDDTVTIGYYDMGNCSGWPDEVYYWQDTMFEMMDKGFTMKNAFKISCWWHPSVADHVRFVGDEDLKVAQSVVVSSEETSIEKPVDIEFEQSNILSVLQSKSLFGELCKTLVLISKEFEFLVNS